MSSCCVYQHCSVSSTCHDCMFVTTSNSLAHAHADVHIVTCPHVSSNMCHAPYFSRSTRTMMRSHISSMSTHSKLWCLSVWIAPSWYMMNGEMRWHVTSRHVMSCHVMSCPLVVMSCHVMSCHVISHHIMSCRIVSCHVMSCDVM